MSTPPNASTTCVERRAHRCGVGDVACDRRAPRRRSPWPCFAAAVQSMSSSATSAPAAANALAVAAPIAPPAPVMTAIWPASGSSLRRAELGLLQRPVFAVEHVGFADRLEAADRLGVGDGFDRGSRRDRRRCARPACRAAEPEQPEPRHQHDAGQGIDHRLAAAEARVVALEIGAVARRRSAATAVARGALEMRRACRRPARGTISGQLLVRMVWSGVMTPALA